MNHKCVSMDNHNNLEIYSPKEGNFWILSITIDTCKDFTHTSTHKITHCPFCGIKL